MLRHSRFFVSLAIMVLVLSIGSLAAGSEFRDYRFFDMNKRLETTLTRSLPELTKKKIVLVGEYHNEMNHHEAQLAVIQAMHGSGVPVAVGLEMFQSGSQKELDRWVSGNMSKRDFQKVYFENWNFPWPTYGMIFEYLRKMKIPMVGLNVSRSVTRHVARSGFGSLSSEERAKLPEVACKVDREYMAFIKRAYGAHAHGQLNFTYFCEAQLVWDKVMALNALKYLEANPGFSMVLLTGTGHAWKKGIPAQIRQRSQIPYAVILPGVAGSIEPGRVSERDADYIILDLQEARVVE